MAMPKLIGRMDSAEEDYFPWKGTSTVLGATEKAIDLNGDDMNLFKGTYKMESYVVSVMICLVLPEVDGTFQGWFEGGGKSLLFDKNGKMTTLLQNIVVEFSDLIGSLLKRNLSVQNFSMENIYVKVFQDLPPKLCILLVKEIASSITRNFHKRSRWSFTAIELALKW
ncbi:hypothetical protein PR202_gb24241 [Eleusine coracana subsp. coracana]|uniref:Uncharacterized protein n=1 Tax=Eleusine coracana subsp. coracana TaxID=191504 RepID=A0AAV5FMG4_ELECO|nr:hypothetical protein PR202_gb24241 [Eleusine coracana subsp. coracana]